jgi:hypothetical protein
MRKMKKLFLTLMLLASHQAQAIEEISLTTKRGFVERITGGVETLIMTPKQVNFQRGPIDSFSLGLVFQGTSAMNFTQEDPELRSVYPLYAEIWTHAEFENNKSEIRASISPSRNVSGFNRQFPATILDLHYKRKVNEHNSLTIGQQRTPVGLNSLVSRANLLLVNRAQIINAHGNSRATGVELEGDYGFFDYSIGGYFSTRHMQNFGEGGEFVGWSNFRPFNRQEGSIFKNLAIGGGVQHGKRGGKDYTVAGLGTGWNYQKWLMVSEFQSANGSNARLYSPNKSQGLYTLLGYNITDKLQIISSYDVFDPDKSKSDDIKTQYTTGLNYYVLRNRLKFSLNYTFETNQAGPNSNYIYFLSQVQI